MPKYGYAIPEAIPRRLMEQMRGIIFRFAVAGKADGVSALSVGVAAVRPLRLRGYTAACSLNAGHYSIFPADCQVIFRRRGVPPVAPAPPALAVPGGGLPALSPARPTFSFVPAPIPQPRARRALFPAGRGRFFSFLMQGASPLASPGAEPERHGDRAAHPAPSERLLPATPTNPPS